MRSAIGHADPLISYAPPADQGRAVHRAHLAAMGDRRDRCACVACWAYIPRPAKNSLLVPTAPVSSVVNRPGQRAHRRCPPGGGQAHPAGTACRWAKLAIETVSGGHPAL
jgi:hypothetical protein